MKFIKTLPLIVLGFGLSVTPALASGDVAAGEKVFKKCKACHVVDAEKHKTGPHLVNIMGRTAGSADGFKKYSDAMKSSGIVWNEETLDAYLENPKAYVKEALTKIAPHCRWTSGTWEHLGMEWNEIQKVGKHLRLLTDVLTHLDSETSQGVR